MEVYRDRNILIDTRNLCIDNLCLEVSETFKKA